MKTRLLIICILLQLSACDSAGTGGGKPAKNKINPPKLDALQAPVVAPDNLEIKETETYLAVFQPLNQQVTPPARGSFTLFKDRDFMVVDVRMNASARNTIHDQNVHIGTSCPTELNDVNEDGIIDVKEAHLATGDILIPLDGDINSQYSLWGMYPEADDWGSYFYSQTASYTTFLEDLRAEDEDPTDNIVKLTDAPLGLAGKVVMIHGISDDVILPETVAGNKDLSSNQSLPIACGVIQIVTDVPGVFEPDDPTIGTTRSGDDTPGSRPRRPSRPARNGETDEDRNAAGTSPLRSRNGSHHSNGSSSGSNQPSCLGDDGKECE